jgi:hypothetical protein
MIYIKFLLNDKKVVNKGHTSVAKPDSSDKILTGG